MLVRRATSEDWAAIWPIWQAVVAAGDTYVWDPATDSETARSLWMLPPPADVWVMVDDSGAVVATAKIVPNQPGLGSHVCNASFMVDPARHGLGLGRQLAVEVIRLAAEAGYEAMQFNAVVATNEAAVRLWESLGFETVGTLPGAFRHARLGPVDLLVMYRRLG